MRFKDYIETVEVPENKVALFWVGQAGFAFKTHGGKKIVLDPYLTNYVRRAIPEEGDGFKRMTAPLFDPEDIKWDILLSSHEHGDHWDIDAVPGLMQEGTEVYANADSIAAAEAAGIDMSKVHEIAKGQVIDCGEFKLYTLNCNHGALAPNAMGFMLDFGFVKIYYSGDTCYDREALAQAIEMQPEVALLPINGAFGNLNAKDAAYLAKDLKAKVCVPHHFWTFPLHNSELGDPLTAYRLFPELAPDCKLQLLVPGEAFLCG